MKYLLTILSLFFICSLSSCITAKKCSERFPPTILQRDSIVFKDTVIIKDTVIHVPGATITKTLYVTDTLTFVDTFFTEGKTHLSLKINKGKITATCTADSLQLVIENLKKIILSRDRFVNVLQYVPKIIERPYIPKWVWWLCITQALSVGWIFRKQIITLLKITT